MVDAGGAPPGLIAPPVQVRPAPRRLRFAVQISTVSPSMKVLVTTDQGKARRSPTISASWRQGPLPTLDVETGNGSKSSATARCAGSTCWWNNLRLEGLDLP